MLIAGYVKWHDNATHEERIKGAQKVPAVFGGVESTPEALEWIWNHHFSAVGGDSPAWEAMPPKGDFFLVSDTFSPVSVSPVSVSLGFILIPFYFNSLRCG